jgi:hypothetical protein
LKNSKSDLFEIYDRLIEFNTRFIAVNPQKKQQKSIFSDVQIPEKKKDRHKKRPSELAVDHLKTRSKNAPLLQNKKKTGPKKRAAAQTKKKRKQMSQASLVYIYTRLVYFSLILPHECDIVYKLGHLEQYE